MKRISLTSEIIVDLFAGGGGASEGIRMATGRDPDVAVNHDVVAVAMHAANHPGTRHLLQDVWQVPPRWACKGLPVGLLWASPDCTHHSKAKGGPPIRDEKKRDLAWVVEKWAREVRPRIIILENVEEFRDWGPLKDGQIIKSQKGQTFRAFVNSLRALGYQVQWRELRACNYGAPTIRRRLFLIARCDGILPCWPELTHGTGKLPYRSAAEIIDWSIPCPSIFDRKKPLAEATLKRIALGIGRYVIGTGNPFIVTIDHQGSRNRCSNDINAPLSTITMKNRHVVCVPHLQRQFGNSIGQSIESPVGTITAGGGGKTALVAAFLAKHYGGVVGQEMKLPLGTVTSVDHHSLVTSHLINLHGTCKDGQDLREPLPTITAGGKHFGEVRAFLMRYYGSGGQLASCSDPLHTIPTKDRMGLVTVWLGGNPYVIVDIGMRMLCPRELFLAQGFGKDYAIDIKVDGKAISKADQVRMCGNSVSPPNAAALISANLLPSQGTDMNFHGGELLQMSMFAEIQK
ncbi:MAG: DNA cytosine methyltransferase [Deltaproteobacteria bacterium]|nr:DNA cytosine methyltransferase [Deltaproteobacteria bacterium]